MTDEQRPAQVGDYLTHVLVGGLQTIRAGGKEMQSDMPERLLACIDQQRETIAALQARADKAEAERDALAEKVERYEDLIVLVKCVEERRGERACLLHCYDLIPLHAEARAIRARRKESEARRG